MAALKILVMGPSWVGDMVLAQSLFMTLKARHPDCIIDVAAPAWTLPLLERMPEVAGTIALTFKPGEFALLKRIRAGLALKNKAYDQAIILTNSFKSAILPFAAGIPQRTSFLGEMRYGLVNDVRPLDKQKMPRTVDRFVSLGLKKDEPLPTNIPEPTLISDRQHAAVTLGQLGFEMPSAKVLGLCPGAEYGEAKRWPAEYYAEVANAALDKGWQVWLFGSEKDVNVTNQINQLTENRCLDFGGKTKLKDAIDLMSLCNKIITNDSGLMHVAAALDLELLAIFGSSTPYHTPPMRPNAAIEYLGLSCSPCFQRQCPLKDESQQYACLRNISPQQILKKMNI